MGIQNKYEFDIVKAYICSFLSDQAYLDSKDIIVPKARSFENTKTHTQGFTVQNGDTYYISFRGTERKFKDVKTDLKFAKCRRSYGKVHAGFLGAYESVRFNLLPRPVNKVVFTGHSLGGAIAQVAALDWAYKIPNIQVEVYTFGSPRVFNKKAYKNYNKLIHQSYHFAHHLDIVTWIPVANYWRTKELVYINSNGEILQDSKFLSRFYDRVRNVNLFDRKFELTADHDRGAYHAAIRKVVHKYDL